MPIAQRRPARLLVRAAQRARAPRLVGPRGHAKLRCRRGRRRRRASPAAAPARARTAPGTTKAAVLAALGDGSALTAGEIAAATGLARATVSTTLSKLAASGEIAKATRGYQLRHETAVDGAGESGAPTDPAVV